MLKKIENMSQSRDRALDSREERTEILLGDLHVTTLMERLPTTVFPVAASLTMQRKTSEDNVFRDFQPPKYPVPIREPTTAYIPDTTVYFENPAEVSDSSSKTWPFDEFAEKFNEQIEGVDMLGSDTSDRIYLTHLRVAEIPAAYVSSERGVRTASSKLYQDEAQMRIGHFNKYTDLSVKGLREELGDALPGEITKPLRLTRIDEVTAKPHDGGAGSSKRRYYTPGQAERHGELDKTPAIWVVKDLLEDDQDARPLELVMSDIDSFFPDLSKSEFFKPVKFYGEQQETQLFVADDVNMLD